MEIEHGVKVPPVTEKWKRIVKGYTVLVQFTSIIVENYMSDCVVAINVKTQNTLEKYCRTQAFFTHWDIYFHINDVNYLNILGSNFELLKNSFMWVDLSSEQHCVGCYRWETYIHFIIRWVSPFDAVSKTIEKQQGVHNPLLRHLDFASTNKLTLSWDRMILVC